MSKSLSLFIFLSIFFKPDHCQGLLSMHKKFDGDIIASFCATVEQRMSYVRWGKKTGKNEQTQYRPW